MILKGLQITKLIDRLLPFIIAVNEKVHTSKLSIYAAVYRVIEDIDNYNRIGAMKNEISNLAMQRFAINQMSAPGDKAITALVRLQACGITDDEILKVYEYLNRVRFESAATILLRTTSTICSLTLNSRLVITASTITNH